MNARFVMGRRFDDSYGLDIGLPGFDIENVDALAEPEKFSFSSKWNRLEKVLAAGVLRNVDVFPSVQLVDVLTLGLDYLPMIDVHLINRSNGYIEDHGWYKHDNPGENPGYSSRYRIYGAQGVRSGISYLSWFLQPVYGYSRALTGRWDIAWVLWDGLDVGAPQSAGL